MKHVFDKVDMVIVTIGAAIVIAAFAAVSVGVIALIDALIEGRFAC